MAYDPSLVVTHPVRQVSSDALVALGRRDGASVGYVLGRSRVPGTGGRADARPPLRGAIASLVLLDGTRAWFHAATLAAGSAGAWALGTSAAKIAAWRSSQSVSANRSTARARAGAA